MRHSSGFARRIVALVTAALVIAPSAGLAFDERPASAAAPSGGVIWESALRAVSAEPLQPRPAKAPDSDRPEERAGASVAEKIAFLYLLIGGSVMLVYGPQEKDGDHVSVDGIAEGIAGAASIAISFGLLRDILHKRAPAPHP
jgi:hypothetical protein